MLKVQIVLQIFVHRMEDQQGSSRIDVRLDQSSLKTLWRLFKDSCASFRSPLCLKAASAHSSPASSRSLAKFACTFMPSTQPAKHGITSPKNPMQRSITFSRVPLVLKDLKAKSRTCSFLHKASQSKQSKQHCRAYCGCSSQSRW